MKKIKYIGILVIGLMVLSGCLKRDDLEDVTIYTTVYPIEYLTTELYGYNSDIKSIYPDGINVEDYSLTEKQLNDYSKSALFVYNGLSDEKKIAAEFINRNKNIKIIDVSQGININYNIEELWLSPANYLMLAQNIKNSLKEYISNKYIEEEIDGNYDKLKIDISEIDAELKIIAQNAESKIIIVSHDMFKFLEKYGYEVISLEQEKDISNTTMNKIKSYFNDNKVSYIFIKENEEINETILNLQNNYSAKLVKIKTITNLSDDERNNSENYLTLMKKNIDAIKDEMYE